MRTTASPNSNSNFHGISQFSIETFGIVALILQFLHVTTETITHFNLVLIIAQNSAEKPVFLAIKSFFYPISKKTNHYIALISVLRKLEHSEAKKTPIAKLDKGQLWQWPVETLAITIVIQENSEKRFSYSGQL